MICERCGSKINVTRGTRGCSYNYNGREGDQDDPNYANLCDECWPEERKYWEEMWREYYASVL